MSLNILKSRDEMDQDTDRILKGQAPLKKSKNKVTKYPKKYKKMKKDIQR